MYLPPGRVRTGLEALATKYLVRWFQNRERCHGKRWYSCHWKSHHERAHLWRPMSFGDCWQWRRGSPTPNDAHFSLRMIFPWSVDPRTGTSTWLKLVWNWAKVVTIKADCYTNLHLSFLYFVHGLLSHKMNAKSQTHWKSRDGGMEMCQEWGFWKFLREFSSHVCRVFVWSENQSPQFHSNLQKAHAGRHRSRISEAERRGLTGKFMEDTDNAEASEDEHWFLKKVNRGQNNTQRQTENSFLPHVSDVFGLPHCNGHDDQSRHHQACVEKHKFDVVPEWITAFPTQWNAK